MLAFCTVYAGHSLRSLWLSNYNLNANACQASCPLRPLNNPATTSSFSNCIKHSMLSSLFVLLWVHMLSSFFVLLRAELRMLLLLLLLQQLLESLTC